MKLVQLATPEDAHIPTFTMRSRSWPNAEVMAAWMHVGCRTGMIYLDSAAMVSGR